MQAFIIRQDHQIAPFGEAAREAIIGGQRLQDLMHAALKEQGFTPSLIDAGQNIESTEAYLLLHEDLFISRRLLRNFVRAAKKCAGNCRLALPDSLLMQNYHHLQDLDRDDDNNYLFDCWWISQKSAELEKAPSLLPTFKEFAHRAAVPKNIVGVEAFNHPITTTVAMRIRHWVHILWINNLTPQIRLIEMIKDRPLSTLWKLLGAFGLSKNAIFNRALRRMVYKGKNVRIHPTALVELSIIGDNVEIGAFAMVRGSVIEADTVIEDRAQVIFSSISPRSFVSRNSTLIMCAGYPDADLCVNGMQFALAGRRAALTSFVRPMDMRVADSAVSVRDDGKTRKIDTHMLGPCFGHDVFIGPDVAIQSGRAVPNGAVILPAPENSLSRLPEHWNQGEIAVIKDGEMQAIKGMSRK